MKMIKTGIDYCICLVGANFGYKNIEHAQDVCNHAQENSNSGFSDFMKVAITAGVPLLIKEIFILLKAIRAKTIANNRNNTADTGNNETAE